MPHLRLLAIASCLMLAACSSNSNDAPSDSEAEPEPMAVAGPVIDSISPSSGPVGMDTPVRVTLFGSGFDEADNTIVFDGIEVPGRPSTEGGTQILVALPKVRPLGTEAPSPVLQAGDYDVSVRTAAGTSAPVTFTLEGN